LQPIVHDQGCILAQFSVIHGGLQSSWDASLRHLSELEFLDSCYPFMWVIGAQVLLCRMRISSTTDPHRPPRPHSCSLGSQPWRARGLGSAATGSLTPQPKRTKYSHMSGELLGRSCSVVLEKTLFPIECKACL